MVFGLAAQKLQELREKQGKEIVAETLFATVRENVSIKNETSTKNLGIDVVYIRELSHVFQALSHLQSKEKILGLDIETYKLPAFAEDPQAGLEPRKSGIRLIQIYDANKTVYVFDILKLGGLQVLGSDIWKMPMVAHNALFELKHLKHKGALPQRLGCTLLLDRVLTGIRFALKETLGLSKNASLKDLSKELLELDVSKEMQISDWSLSELTEEQIEYAALDAVLTAKIFSIQWELLRKRGLEPAYRIVHDAQPAVARMELAGIGFDVARHKGRIQEWQKEADQLQQEILSALGKELNINSGKQLGEWLEAAIEEKDLEKWAKTDGGKLSTSTNTFKLNEHMHDIFPKIVEYRHVAKRINSFGESFYKFIDQENNRLYGSFFLGATATGRMSSRNPNMQNIPRTGFRDLFCAKPGYCLIGLDYSQQELRVAALISGDRALLRLYAEGGDVHRNTASQILQIPQEQVNKSQRQMAKAVIFGWLYGMGAPSLVSYAKTNYDVEMSLEDAKQCLQGLLKSYPTLAQWQKTQSAGAKITGKVQTPYGRIRDFHREAPPEWKRDKPYWWYCESLNTPIQGGAAECILKALARINADRKSVV